MRDVRGELAPETLGAQLFGHVHGQEHDAVLGFAGYHGAGGQHILALAAGDIALRPLAAAALFKQLAHLRRAVYRQHVAALARGVHSEYLPCAGVHAHNHARAVYKYQALAHGVGYSGELLLAPVQLFQLRSYLPLLMLHAAQQGAELVVHLVLQRLVQVDGVEWADYALGKARGQPCGQEQSKQKYEQQRLDYAEQQRRDSVMGLRRAQDAPVRQAYGIIDRLFRERVARALAFAVAVLQRFAELLALGVVLHIPGLGVGVVYDRAVGRYPGEADIIVVQSVEVVQPAELHAVGCKLRLHAQLLGLMGGEIVVQRAYDKGEPGQKDHQARQKDAAENTLCHGLASIRYPTPRTVPIIAPHSPSFWRRVRMCTSTVRVSPS